MIRERKERFTSFGLLDTWIVGVQYYEGREAAEDRDVVFERDPENPFDANAIGVYATDGEQLGHLPRYDAEYMSPLIVEGAIALRGKAGKSERNDRVPLRLEVFATDKVQGVMDESEANDWRAIYHNLFVQVWRRLDHYSAAALEAFRNRFREIAHQETLYPQTQFLYRMLKARIKQMKRNETEVWKQRVIQALDGITIGAPLGWNEMAVYPLFDPGAATPGEPVFSKDEESAGDRSIVRKSSALSALPRRCPYPSGASGVLILVHNTFYVLEWFENPGECEVYWFALCAGAMDIARIPLANGATADPVESTREDVKERLRDMLQHARCTVADTEDRTGLLRIQLDGEYWNGYAQWRDGQCARIHWRCEQGTEDQVLQ